MVKFCTAELQGKYLQTHSDGDQKYIIIWRQSGRTL